MTLRVALFGAGFIAKHHAQGWSRVPGTKIVGLFSPSGRGFDGRFGQQGNLGADDFTLDMNGVRCSKSTNDFLDEGIDVIDICTPTPTHKQLVLAALDAGKHVVCEKPLTRNVADAKLLAAAAAKSKGMSMAAHCMRFWDGWLQLPVWMKHRAFGDFYGARFSRVTDVPGWSPAFRDGTKTGGAKDDLMIHDVDLMLATFGMPSNVMARGCNVVSSDAALDDVTALFSYPGGAYVSIETSWARHPKLGFEAKFEVRCRNATITGGFAAPGLQVHGASVPNIPLPFQYGQATGWEGQLHYFAECIATGKRPAVASFDDAVRALVVSEAIERSVREGVAISIA